MDTKAPILYSFPRPFGDVSKLSMYLHALVVFVMSTSTLFKVAVAIVWFASWGS